MVPTVMSGMITADREGHSTGLSRDKEDGQDKNEKGRAYLFVQDVPPIRTCRALSAQASRAIDDGGVGAVEKQQRQRQENIIKKRIRKYCGWGALGLCGRISFGHKG